ncbi:hypothetical protein [Nitriliruptor alkaliphilus]|uniref:hypothetical protein n=1 Tax=Nitriliruptor alkaliphilus TaxID=427918 RepID=UPI00069868D1|nr:hypothetical protein [Nitriliruptor alkaliphilus]
MRSNARWAALGAGLLFTTSLTACNGGGTDAEDDPTTALQEAVEALADYDGIELRLSIDGDRDAIIEAADGELDEDTADLLLGSSLLLRAAGEDEADAQAEFIVELGGREAVEVRVLPEQRFFVRVDLDAIGDVVDDPDFASGVDEAVGMAEAFGLGEVASAARAGDWIELKGFEQLAEFAGGFGGDTTEDEPTEEQIEDVRERIVASFQRFLAQDVTLEHVGEESAGDRITATTTEGDLARLFEEISRIAGDLSGVDPDAFGDTGVDTTSDTPVQLDFWIDGGELRQVGYDLSQIEGDDTAPEGTYVLATIAEFSGTVEAPADAVEIDLFAIIGNMFGGMGDFGGFDDFDDFDDDGFGDDDFGDEPLGGDCIPQEQIDALTGGDEAAQAELDAAVEMGLIEIC